LNSASRATRCGLPWNAPPARTAPAKPQNQFRHGGDGIETAPIHAHALGNIAQAIDLALPYSLVAQQAGKKNQ
jgi:hypothetical protein